MRVTFSMRSQLDFGKSMYRRNYRCIRTFMYASAKHIKFPFGNILFAYRLHLSHLLLWFRMNYLLGFVFVNVTFSLGIAPKINAQKSGLDKNVSYQSVERWFLLKEIFRILLSIEIQAAKQTNQNRVSRLPIMKRHWVSVLHSILNGET